MRRLNQDEIKEISGGININLTPFYGPAGRAGLITMKKLSMVYCIGKEIKSGIQNLDPWAIVRATGCIYISSFCREMVALKVKKS